MALNDSYAHNETRGGFPVGPIGSARLVVFNDEDDLPDGPCRAIWVDTSGDLEVILAGDRQAVVFGAVPEKTIIPLACKRILSGNTTASNVFALY